MTVLFLSPKFFPHIGGVEKHAYEVARKLMEKGNRVIVITEGDKKSKEKIGGIEVYRLNFGSDDWFKKFRIWFKIFGMRNLIRTSKIVHCHDVFFWYLPLRLLFPKKKVFITFHGFENIPPTRKEIFIRKFSEKLSNGNIIVGKYIEKWYGTKPNLVTYGAIDKVYDYKKIKRIIKPRILLIGRLDKDIAIISYAKTLSLLKNFTLEVCGDGKFRKILERYGKVHGFVKNPNKFIKKSDLIFASSYLSIMEALSFGKPVFSLYENNLKKDYLLLSPFKDFINVADSPKSLSNEVKSILENYTKREEMIKRGQEWLKRQTWDYLANQYLSLWA